MRAQRVIAVVALSFTLSGIADPFRAVDIRPTFAVDTGDGNQ